MLIIDIIIYVNIFIIGSLFGSFFSLATYRLPKGEDIISTRSYCPKCKHKLNFFDLIPILSYIFRGGKCKYCHDRISPRYILLEAFNGLFFVLLYYLFNFNITFFVTIFIYIVLVIGSSLLKKKDNLVNKKNGVFVVELIIAMLIFTVFISTSYITYRNYTAKQVDTTIRNNGIISCIKDTEILLATNFDYIMDTTTNHEINNVNYEVKINVENYKENNLIKKVNSSVLYKINEEEYIFKFSTFVKKEI